MHDVIEASFSDISVIWVVASYVSDIRKKGVNTRGEGSQVPSFGFKRVHVLSHSLGYLSVSCHQVCQEYSTKWEYLFSLLFSMIMHY